jgi:hypothetical protein
MIGAGVITMFWYSWNYLLGSEEEELQQLKKYAILPIYKKDDKSEFIPVKNITSTKYMPHIIQHSSHNGNFICSRNFFLMIVVDFDVRDELLFR